MSRQTLLAAVLGLSALNGIFSPFLALAVPIAAVLMPELFPKSQEWVLFFSSLLVASATLLSSGVPAALWERLIARDPDSKAAMWIWLAGAAALTAPAYATIAGR